MVRKLGKYFHRNSTHLTSSWCWCRHFIRFCLFVWRDSESLFCCFFFSLTFAQIVVLVVLVFIWIGIYAFNFNTSLSTLSSHCIACHITSLLRSRDVVFMDDSLWLMLCWLIVRLYAMHCEIGAHIWHTVENWKKK